MSLSALSSGIALMIGSKSLFLVLLAEGVGNTQKIPNGAYHVSLCMKIELRMRLSDLSGIRKDGNFQKFLIAGFARSTPMFSCSDKQCCTQRILIGG